MAFEGQAGFVSKTPGMEIDTGCQVPASRRYKKKAGRFTHKRWNHAEKEKDFLTPAKLRDRS
ncbi:hypothetical protein CISG_01284 [Coccidioides immitis RMSCC 3703]|uniref:Uncharacterized protein n=2 Tax=Coccidioides immitis TaxID=5501 RepID=A0A0J8TS22_COCIT|nr:hypothetical protein CIRG_01613 [Coccidioides immitis RMSCC 2394]KMU76552.1 hypothetical protein CISG_01284 [Coccidioides immitis RMSCC 3703]